MVDLSWTSMAVMYLLLILPAGVLMYTRAARPTELLVGAIRMTIQLLLVGLYLRYIFEINSVWLSGLWIVVMLLTANVSILNKAGLKLKAFFLSTLTAVAGGTLLVSGFMILIGIRPDPLYDARYVIPITGMVLGNCMRGNVMVLDRFYSALQNREQEYITCLMLGADRSEALRPFMRDAVRAALSPMLSTMATMGIVSLPGMMTGQILGGSLPLVAIKYQLAIMICIFSSMSVSALLNILLSSRVAFDAFHVLRREVFRSR